MASNSRSTLHRRPVNPSTTRCAAGGRLVPDVDPPPKPPAILQVLSFGIIVFLACLQFLPATHIRDPRNPLRYWIPLGPNRTVKSENVEIGRIHVVSWTDCLDLRAIAVLVNSTLSSSRSPENIHFHFFIPEGEDEELSYYKLKVLLPHSNMDIIGQKEVKEKLQIALPEWNLLWSSLEIIPLVIPLINHSWSRYLYVSSDTMIKGNVEELYGVHLGLYAIAAATDCSRILGSYVNIDVVNAIQRTAAKSWVSDEPYDKNACTPDFSLLLVHAEKLDKELMKAISWWIKVLNLKDEGNIKINAAVALALHSKYLKLPSLWKIHDSVSSGFQNETNVLRYDGPARVCSEDKRQHQELDTSNTWRQYLNPKSDGVLAR
ncbi:uncharacterized protein A4U43_C03F6620 [Asparagus officinalis]|uniref:Hexosyltransferase n=1 Tax=Asparagus officinalis TaxID=4686 RepID=A0A5P1FCZ0_ASPOF|nr:uncharacterized protein LOC109833100 [Asparagus officinalis]ONK74471.1 uncharacterized protein A4U43_C03F6620 [Asparagus officinalis]